MLYEYKPFSTYIMFPYALSEIILLANNKSNN